MNPKQQKTHRTVTADLARNLEGFARAMEERLDTNDKELARLAGLIGQERAARLKLADEQRAYVDNQNRLLLNRLDEGYGRSFWWRLRWLVTGR